MMNTILNISVALVVRDCDYDVDGENEGDKKD